MSLNGSALHTKYTENIHRFDGSWIRPSKPCEKRRAVEIFSSVYGEVRQLSIGDFSLVVIVWSLSIDEVLCRGQRAKARAARRDFPVAVTTDHLPTLVRAIRVIP